MTRDCQCSLALPKVSWIRLQCVVMVFPDHSLFFVFAGYY